MADATAHLQQSMALMGLIPAVIRLAGHTTALPIRCEAALFMHQFCHFSDPSRKMFIACGGLPSLVALLLPPQSSHEYYIATRPLLYTAIECIKCVFDITVRTQTRISLSLSHCVCVSQTSPRNDFCRLFCKFGLLAPLMTTVIALALDAYVITTISHIKHHLVVPNMCYARVNI